MKRAALERNHCLRQMRLYERTLGRYWHAGRFRKRKCMDCGRPQCQACNPEKYPIRNNGKERQKLRREISGRQDD